MEKLSSSQTKQACLAIVGFNLITFTLFVLPWVNLSAASFSGWAINAFAVLLVLLMVCLLVKAVCSYRS